MEQPIGFIDFRLCTDDLRTAIGNLDGKIPFHVRPSAEDILTRSEKRIRNQLEAILCICKKQNWALRLDDFEPDNPTEADVEVEKRYLSVAKRVGEENLEYTNG